MTSLSARDLTISAGGRRLVSNFSFALGEGELVALVGPSGSGKTTLLRCVALLQDPDAGELSLGGRSPGELGYPTWRRKVALVAQRPVLLSTTVRQNLARPFGYAVSAGSFPEPRAREWLERLGLDASRMDQDATTLSEGQQQRVGLVRTMLVEPEVLLLDEPTAALDADAVAAAESWVRDRLRETGGSALIVTHDRAQAERWCDRVLELSDA